MSRPRNPLAAECLAELTRLRARVAGIDAEYVEHERSLECQCWGCMTYQIQQLDVDVAMRDTQIEKLAETVSALRDANAYVSKALVEMARPRLPGEYRISDHDLTALAARLESATHPTPGDSK